MIRIVDDKTNEVKAEMKEMQRHIEAELRDIKKKKRSPNMSRSIEDRKRIDWLEKKKEFFKSTSHLPVRLGTIVIDYKTLSAFLKKLKSFNITTKIDDSGLTIIYKKHGHPGGELRLLDMTDHYKVLRELPTIEIDTLEEVTA